jgi:hypothetical protein
MGLQRKQPPVPRDPFSQFPAAQLEHEFAQERAAALGRLGRALEAALCALRAFDRAHPSEGARSPSREQRSLRAALVAQASFALWQFIVQREATGLRDARQVMRDYRVPLEVAAGMGAMPAKAPQLRR